MENNENNGPKKFNLNSYWIYGIIILAILAINLSVMVNTKTKVISLGKFDGFIAINCGAIPPFL